MKVIRPGALVDYRDFDPPGRLGKRLGNIFVAVGSSNDRLGVVDVGFAGRFLGWMTDAWDNVPTPLNLLDPVSPTKRELLDRLSPGQSRPHGGLAAQNGAPTAIMAGDVGAKAVASGQAGHRCGQSVQRIALRHVCNRQACLPDGSLC